MISIPVLYQSAIVMTQLVKLSIGKFSHFDQQQSDNDFRFWWIEMMHNLKDAHTQNSWTFYEFGVQSLDASIGFYGVELARAFDSKTSQTLH